MLGYIGKDAKHDLKANGLGVPSWSILSGKICGIWRQLSGEEQSELQKYLPAIKGTRTTPTLVRGG